MASISRCIRRAALRPQSLGLSPIRPFSVSLAQRTAADQNDKAAKSPAFKKQNPKKQPFDQDPSISNVTVSQSSPKATNEYVVGSPEPSSYREGYQAPAEDDPNTKWMPSSTSTAPAHRGLAEDVKAGEPAPMQKEGTTGKLPPDFNDHIAQRAPDWPGKKEEMKEQDAEEYLEAS